LKLILKLLTLFISITATCGVSTAGADCKNIDLPGALYYKSYLSFGWLRELGRNTGWFGWRSAQEEVAHRFPTAAALSRHGTGRRLCRMENKLRVTRTAWLLDSPWGAEAQKKR